MATVKQPGNYIFDAFKRCDKYFTQNNMYEDTKKCVRFFEGDQWYDEKQPDYRSLPFYNFIQPVVNYKVAMIAKNNMVINYTPLNTSNYTEYKQLCSALNQYAAEKWEVLKMDTKLWEIVSKAAVTGESYLYFGGDDVDSGQIIDKTNMFFGDEQEHDLQNQPFIIIRERRSVLEIRAAAKNAGCKREEIDRIVSDQPKDQVNNENKEELLTDGKVTSYLYFTRNNNGFVTFARATETVVFEKETEITGMTMYPIVNYVWKRKYNSARGLGEVKEMIPNQITVNKLLLRREVNNKQTGYAHPVYNKEFIQNPDDLDKVGAKIEVDGFTEVSDVSKAFTYVQPAPMSTDAEKLTTEIIETTRNLANASDSATGNVDPAQASGKAISLVIDQNAVMLTEQQAAYSQLVEDIALVWYDKWRLYNNQNFNIGWDMQNGREEYEVQTQLLQTMDVRVRIDVSSNNPWSVYANDQEAMNLFGNGYISFEDYVNLLSDQNNMKPKLQEIVMRQQMMMQQQQAEQMAMQAAMAQGAPPPGIADPTMAVGGQVPMDLPIALGGVPPEEMPQM